MGREREGGRVCSRRWRALIVDTLQARQPAVTSASGRQAEAWVKRRALVCIASALARRNSKKGQADPASTAAVNEAPLADTFRCAREEMTGDSERERVAVSSLLQARRFLHALASRTPGFFPTKTAPQYEAKTSELAHHNPGSGRSRRIYEIRSACRYGCRRACVDVCDKDVCKFGCRSACHLMRRPRAQKQTNVVAAAVTQGRAWRQVTLSIAPAELETASSKLSRRHEGFVNSLQGQPGSRLTVRRLALENSQR